MTRLDRPLNNASRALAIALLALLNVACQSEAPAVDELDVVRVHLPAAPPSMSLIGKPSRYTLEIAAQITDALVVRDAAMEYRPQVAESWEWSTDRKTITFSLRRDVRWHDGTPLTAADVEFTLNAVRDPATENLTYLSSFEHVTSIDVIDDHTLAITFSESSFETLDAFRVPLVPKHLAKSGAELFTSEFAKHPTGCGPFRFESYRVDEEIVLVANDDYWDGRPKIDKLVFRFFPDMRTAYLSMVNGDVDVMVATPDLLEQAQTSGPERLTSKLYDRTSAYVITWNTKSGHPALRDPRVRRATMHALDRETFAEEVHRGLARPGVTTWWPFSNWRNPDVNALGYAPDEAARLLAEAGWVDRDGDGVRDRDGVALELEYVYPESRQRISQQMAEWVAASLMDVGIRINLVQREFSTLRKKREAREFDGVLTSMGFTTLDQQELYHSEFDRPEGYNFSGLNDPRVDELLKRGRQAFDEAERREIYDELQVRVAELQPVSVLFHFRAPLLHDRRIENLTVSPLGVFRILEGPARWELAAE